MDHNVFPAVYTSESSLSMEFGQTTPQIKYIKKPCEFYVC